MRADCRTVPFSQGLASWGLILLLWSCVQVSHTAQALLRAEQSWGLIYGARPACQADTPAFLPDSQGRSRCLQGPNCKQEERILQNISCCFLPLLPFQ